jgi:hypothetical protein
LTFIHQFSPNEYESGAEFPRKLLNLMIAMPGKKVSDKDDRLKTPIS